MTIAKVNCKAQKSFVNIHCSENTKEQCLHIMQIFSDIHFAKVEDIVNIDIEANQKNVNAFHIFYDSQYL